MKMNPDLFSGREVSGISLCPEADTGVRDAVSGRICSDRRACLTGMSVSIRGNRDSRNAQEYMDPLPP